MFFSSFLILTATDPTLSPNFTASNLIYLSASKEPDSIGYQIISELFNPEDGSCEQSFYQQNKCSQEALTEFVKKVANFITKFHKPILIKINCSDGFTEEDKKILHHLASLNHVYFFGYYQLPKDITPANHLFKHLNQIAESNKQTLYQSFLLSKVFISFLETEEDSRSTLLEKEASEIWAINNGAANCKKILNGGNSCDSQDILEQVKDIKDELSKSTRNVLSQQGSYFLAHYPYFRNALTGSASRVNWEMLKDILPVLPDIPNDMRLEDGKIDHQKIQNFVDDFCRDLKHNELAKNIEEKVLENPFTSELEIQLVFHIFVKLKEWHENPTKRELVPGLVDTLNDRFNMCHNAQFEIFNQFVNILYRDKQGIALSDKINEAIAQKKYLITQEVLGVTLQTPPKDLAEYVAYKLQQNMPVTFLEQQLYERYFWLSAIKKAKENNKFLGIHYLPELIRKNMVDSSDAITPMLSYIAPSIGLLSERELSNNVFSLALQYDGDGHIIAIKNRIDADCLIELVENMLRPLDKQEQIKTAQTSKERSQKERDAHLTPDIIFEDSYFKNHADQIIEKYHYYRCIKSINMIKLGSKHAKLNADDLVRADLVSDSNKQYFDEETEEFNDFKPKAAEKILEILGYVYPADKEISYQKTCPIIIRSGH